MTSSPSSTLTSSTSSNYQKESHNICYVAYALNAKKLRKSACQNNSQKKIWSGGGLADILTDEVEEGVSFKSFDFDLPLEDQPYYHVIIHKITEDIRQKNDPESQRKVELLQNYLELYPKTTIIDPIHYVENVITRSRVCNVLQMIIRNIPQEFRMPTPLFSQPKFLIVTQKEKIHEIFLKSTLRFPVICKPIEACGTPNSHSMVVAMSLDGLSLVESPCIIQEYWDHSGTFYKVYVIDDDVMVYRRPSLPDIQELSHHHALRSIIFDSRYAYPTIDDFVIPDDSNCHHHNLSLHTPIDSNDISPIPYDFTQLNSHNESSRSSEIFPLSSYSSCSSSQEIEFHYPYDDPPVTSGSYVHHTPHRGLKPGASPCHKVHKHSQQEGHKVHHPFTTENIFNRISHQVTTEDERFKDIASHLKKGFGLTLFGFDVLIPNQPSSMHRGEAEFLIIDVNFFPSYKEVQDFPSRLRKMLRKKSTGLFSPQPTNFPLAISPSITSSSSPLPCESVRKI